MLIGCGWPLAMRWCRATSDQVVPCRRNHLTHFPAFSGHRPDPPGHDSTRHFGSHFGSPCDPKSVHHPDTSKPPTAFPLAGGPSSVSTQSAPEGIRTPNLLIRSQMLYPLSSGARRASAQRESRLPERFTGREIRRRSLAPWARPPPPDQLLHVARPRLRSAPVCEEPHNAQALPRSPPPGTRAYLGIEAPSGGRRVTVSSGRAGTFQVADELSPDRRKDHHDDAGRAHGTGHEPRRPAGLGRRGGHPHHPGRRGVGHGVGRGVGPPDDTARRGRHLHPPQPEQEAELVPRGIRPDRCRPRRGPDVHLLGEGGGRRLHEQLEVSLGDEGRR